MEEDFDNLDVERQQRNNLEKMKQDQENEKKSLDLIARLSIEDSVVQPERQFTSGRETVLPAKRFLSNHLPGLREKGFTQAPSASERIAALKPAAVARGTFVEEEKLQNPNSEGVQQVPAGNLTGSRQKSESKRQAEQ